MKKRIASLMLVFAMVLSVMTAAMPVLAAPTESTCTYTIEADKTTAKPGDTLNFTIYMQQTGTMTALEGTLTIPSGLTFVKDSGVLTKGIKETLGWDAVDWTPDPKMILNGYGAEDFAGTEKLALMTFQCTVDSDAAAGEYKVDLLDLVADGGSTENYETKNPTCVPATITVTAEAGPCTHANKTTVPEKASNCTERGWDAYQTCDDCGALLNMSGDPIAEIPYRELNDDHDYAAEWSSDASGHWHTCTRCGDKGGKAAHTPGAPATETEPQTCTVCGYELQPATGHLCIEHLTKVDRVEADCITDGNEEYYQCSCGKLYWDDDAFDEITGSDSTVIPALGHDYAAEWSSDAFDHWHACTRCGDKAETAAHTPDHEGGATSEYPILCSVCGYVMEEQLEQDEIVTIEVPFKLTVKKTGEMDPGKEIFRFMAEEFGAPVEYIIVKDTVEINGEKT